jgi:hypothetical protein
MVLKNRKNVEYDKARSKDGLPPEPIVSWHFNEVLANGQVLTVIDDMWDNKGFSKEGLCPVCIHSFP